MITAENYAEALYGAIHETDPKDHDKLLDNFVKILNEQGDIGKYPEIEKAFAAIERREGGTVNVRVTTAHETKDAEALLKHLNIVAGKKISAEHSVDRNLIGGMVIRAGDTLIDASVSGEIERLKQAIGTGSTNSMHS